jgi:hypothetical protein
MFFANRTSRGFDTYPDVQRLLHHRHGSDSSRRVAFVNNAAIHPAFEEV